MALKEPNEEQVKFMKELEADPKLGETYTDLMKFAIESMARLAQAREAADLKNHPEREEVVDMLTKLTAMAISSSTDAAFPEDKHIHVKLRQDMTHYLKLCGAIKPDEHWDDEQRKLVKDNV